MKGLISEALKSSFYVLKITINWSINHELIVELSKGIISLSLHLSLHNKRNDYNYKEQIVTIITLSSAVTVEILQWYHHADSF